MFYLSRPNLKKTALLSLCLLVVGCAANDTLQSTAPLTQKEQNLIQLARASENAPNISQSVRLYEQAIDLSKGNVEAHMALANLYDRKNMRDKALQVMLDAKKKQPTHPIINQQLGKYYLYKADEEKALTYYNDGLKHNPHNAALLNGKGLALVSLGRNQEAQAAYNQGLIAPSDIRDELLYNLATSHMLTGDYDKALSYLTTIEPKGNAVRKQLAVVHSLKGNKNSARKWRGKNISKDAVDKSAVFYRSYYDNSQK